jgi:hypothetical protein
MGFATSIDKTSADGINQSAMSSLMRRLNSTTAQKADPDLKEIIRQTVEETVKAMSGNAPEMKKEEKKEEKQEPVSVSLASKLFSMKKEKNNA